MKILGIDIGFGNVKVIFGDESRQVKKQFKIPSVIGITKKNEFIKDSKIFEYKQNAYYVGEDAQALPSESLIDITDYKNLEYYAPLFVAYAIQEIGEVPDIIVSGLSKAQIQNSGYFKDAISNFEVSGKTYHFDKVFIIPQGAGSKIVFSEYGLDYPNTQTDFTGKSNYIGIDIGFNTLDLYRVVNGKTSASVFDGIEHQGIMKIASRIAFLIKNKHNRDITLHEAKEILDSRGMYKLRGNSFDYSEEIKEIKRNYIKELLDLVEEKYGKVLDKCDCIFLSGGGSAFFKSGTYEGNNILAPKSNFEYYNALGQYLFGIEQAAKIS